MDKIINHYQQIVKNLPNIESEVLKPYLTKALKAFQQIVLELKNQQIAPLNIAFETQDLELIFNLAREINQKFKKIFVLGVGGSSLGGKTLTSIAKNFTDKIIFIESIDSCFIANQLNNLNQNYHLKDILFLVISKSGETIETICQTLIFIENLKQKNVSNFGNNFIFITQDQQNSIAKIALEIGSRIYFHPENIGGRFSYLTIVGLLPAAICGLDIFAIRNGAVQVLNEFINQDLKRNKIIEITAYQLYLFDQGLKNSVIMPYIDSLKDFTDWHRQLWAESLGKNGFGSTPINSMGTVDQHSQLQLYLEGPRDKFFTFIINKNPENNFQVIDIANCPTLFGGKNLNEIIKIEQESTIEVLNQKKLPIRILEIEYLNEKTLSSLMMQMFLETIIMAKMQNINPFDQPAVELRKDLAKKYLNYDK